MKDHLLQLALEVARAARDATKLGELALPHPIFGLYYPLNKFEQALAAYQQWEKTKEVALSVNVRCEEPPPKDWGTWNHKANKFLTANGEIILDTEEWTRHFVGVMRQDGFHYEARHKDNPGHLAIPQGATCTHPNMTECHEGCGHFSCPDCGLVWDDNAEGHFPRSQQRADSISPDR